MTLFALCIAIEVRSRLSETLSNGKYFGLAPDMGRPADPEAHPTCIREAVVISTALSAGVMPWVSPDDDQ